MNKLSSLHSRARIFFHKQLTLVIMEYKSMSTVYPRLGTTSLDTENREYWLRVSPSIDDLDGVPPTLDIDFVLIFICFCTVILTAVAGVGIYYLYDHYAHWYPDHLYTHQRYIETYQLW